MPLGIKPTVDFAFKKIFGSPQNSLALIGLLNAILDFDEPVESVEVLNPFSYHEFAEKKLIILDLRCRDTAGRWLNVEMQVSSYSGLIERLLYYACSMYVDQLAVGQNYSKANAAISICLLNHQLFHDTDQAHHRFQMVDIPSGRELYNSIEVHTVELTKYNWDVSTIAKSSKLEQWAYLLLHAHHHDATSLKQLLPGIEFEQAIRTIENISAITKDRVMYDQQEKAQRDYQWAIAGAREEGLEKGREEGLEKGKLVAKIQTFQELLGDEISTDAELLNLGLDAMRRDLELLQQRLRKRDS